MKVNKHNGVSNPWDVARKSLFTDSPQNIQQDFLLPIYYKPRDSFRLMTWILRYSSLKRYERLVALEIAGHYNFKHGYAWPNYSHLKEELGISDRKIATVIHNLKLSGEWLVVPVAKNSYTRAISNRYYPLTPISLQDYNQHSAIFQQQGYFNSNGKWIPSIVHPDIASYNAFRKKIR